VSHSEHLQDKFSQHLQPRKPKPFIDQNLQLQHPDPEQRTAGMIRSYNPIYAHYTGGASPLAYLIPQVNEPELNRAMEEADLSYEAWKLMKEQLQQKIKTDRSS
jgi:hypothetical protein